MGQNVFCVETQSICRLNVEAQMFEEYRQDRWHVRIAGRENRALTQPRRKRKSGRI